MSSSLQEITIKSISQKLNLNLPPHLTFMILKDIMRLQYFYELAVESKVGKSVLSKSIVISDDIDRISEIKQYLEEKYNHGNIDEISFFKDVKKRFGLDLFHKRPVFNYGNEGEGEKILHTYKLDRINYV